MTPSLLLHSTKPRYRINTVAAILGVNAANLRAWERRYGIPNPKRGDNSYRLYSDQDLNLLKLMKALCEAGHAPSNAAQIALSKHASRSEPEPKAVSSLREMKEALIDSAINFEAQSIEQILSTAIMKESAWTVFRELIEPALHEMGTLWEQDQSYLASEHLLTHSVKGVLVQLLKMIRPPYPRKRILLACVAHELHDISLYALGLRISHAGCLPIIIGANTPASALKTAVKQINPDVVLLSATTALSCIEGSRKSIHEMQEEMISGNDIWVTHEELLTSLRLYKASCEDIPWLIGGQSERTWPELPTDLKSHVCTNTASLDQLLL